LASAVDAHYAFGSITWIFDYQSQALNSQGWSLEVSQRRSNRKAQPTVVVEISIFFVKNTFPASAIAAGGAHPASAGLPVQRYAGWPAFAFLGSGTFIDCRFYFAGRAPHSGNRRHPEKQFDGSFPVADHFIMFHPSHVVITARNVNAANAMRILRDELPNIEVTVVSQYSPELADALVRGKLDAAFLRREKQAADLVFKTVTKEPLIVIMPSDHRIATHDAVDPMEIRGEIFITVSSTAPTLAWLLTTT
jgi:LysR substrate binding domain